jgi:hypothetical protein
MHSAQRVWIQTGEAFNFMPQTIWPSFSPIYKVVADQRVMIQRYIDPTQNSLAAQDDHLAKRLKMQQTAFQTHINGTKKNPIRMDGESLINACRRK